MSRQIFQLRIALVDVAPTVWRRVAVPGGFTLDRIHRVIQYVMGWQDYHLHSFEIGNVQYGVPDPNGELDLHDELDFRLDALASKDSRLTYVYDFGDWWEHEIVVETLHPAEPDERYPLCLEGERACPPEDVGGVHGYGQFLEALGDPGHPEHFAMRDWIGRRFDAEFFDPDRATVLLRRLV
jgi:hypothetical protein